MDCDVMPEIVPMWISGFDKIMPESRGFPRFLPRPGAQISVTVGEPVTGSITDLVKAWKDLAAKEPGTVGLGGTWDPKRDDAPSEHEQRDIRGQGRMAEGKEEEIRTQITATLRERLQELGQYVEGKEGRLDTGEWSQSRRRQTEVKA